MRALFAGDLGASIAAGLEWEANLITGFDEHAGVAPERRSTEAPDLPDVRELDLADVGAIVWATGFRPDYSWIELPVLGDSGRPVHRRGLTELPGLAFVGMHWLHKRKSSLFLGVGEDAEHVVSQLL
jgi:putative flavoprotein involved in K+ transport